jgi:hypothetical protein
VIHLNYFIYILFDSTNRHNIKNSLLKIEQSFKTFLFPVSLQFHPRLRMHNMLAILHSFGPNSEVSSYKLFSFLISNKLSFQAINYHFSKIVSNPIQTMNNPNKKSRANFNHALMRACSICSVLPQLTRWPPTFTRNRRQSGRRRMTGPTDSATHWSSRIENAWYVLPKVATWTSSFVTFARGYPTNCTSGPTVLAHAISDLCRLVRGRAGSERNEHSRAHLPRGGGRPYCCKTY